MSIGPPCPGSITTATVVIGWPSVNVAVLPQGVVTKWPPATVSMIATGIPVGEIKPNGCAATEVVAVVVTKAVVVGEDVDDVVKFVGDVVVNCDTADEQAVRVTTSATTIRRFGIIAGRTLA